MCIYYHPIITNTQVPQKAFLNHRKYFLTSHSGHMLTGYKVHATGQGLIANWINYLAIADGGKPTETRYFNRIAAYRHISPLAPQA